LLLNSIVSTLLRAAEKIPNEYEYISGNVREFIGRFTGESDIELQFKELRKYILDFCKRVNESKRSERTGLIKQIIDFIDANYQDCQISLASVASKFNITESYLSRFFKEQTGENFSKYIERLRMEKAHELLNKQNLPVSAVAEKVGYNYPQVFRRVYKRYFGITPSMSRKN